MPVIRRTFNFGAIFLAPHVVKGKVLCGQTVEVIHVHGESTVEHFSGFISFTEIDQLHSCVITGIEAFTPEDDWFWGEYTWYNRHDWLLGHKFNKGVYLVTMDNGLPLVVNKYDESRDPYRQPKRGRPNNVYSISDRIA